MTELARSRGYTVWIDRENPLEKTTDEGLASHLLEALGSCCYVVFFETSARMVAQVNGPTIRDLSWQERELDYAEASRVIVLYQSKDPSLIGLGINRNLCPYRDLDDALTQIERAISDPDLFISQRSPCGGGDGGSTRKGKPGHRVKSEPKWTEGTSEQAGGGVL